MGVNNIEMFRRHLLPNILGPIAVYATLTIPQPLVVLPPFFSKDPAANNPVATTRSKSRDIACASNF